MMSEDKLRIADRFEIEDVLCRYARGVDRKDWALFRSAYHDDAVDDHGDIVGTPDELVTAVRRRHEKMTQSLHAQYKSCIEFAGPDKAVAETPFTVVQSLGDDDADYRDSLSDLRLATGQIMHLRIWGRYVDLFTRKAGAWKIQRRSVVIEQTIVEPRVARDRDGWISASRDGDDRIESLRREVGLA